MPSYKDREDKVVTDSVPGTDSAGNPQDVISYSDGSQTLATSYPEKDGSGNTMVEADYPHPSGNKIGHTTDHPDGEDPNLHGTHSN